MFLEWYGSSPLGQALQRSETAYLLNELQLTYYQKILQVGALGTETQFIGEEFRRNFGLVIGEEVNGNRSLSQIRAHPGELPIASESTDILLLPHILEFEPNPHQLLREAERVLKPEGRLIVLGFNPWSLHGIASHLPVRHGFWSRSFIGYHRLIDWLHLLRFEAEFSAGFTLARSTIILRPDNLLNRSMAYVATAYAIRAIKRTYTLIPVKPEWISAPSLIPNHAVDVPILSKHS